MNLTQDMARYAASCQGALQALIRELCVLPAPSGHEEQRAAFCKNWLVRNGFHDVKIDTAKNVLAAYGVADSNPIVLFSAHTDVVFPDEKPLPFHSDGERFYCPGICDDTANLAVLLLSARYFVQNRLAPKYGILFAANSCEEGLGNLKGIREIFRQYGSRIVEHITFDGTSLDETVTEAVGSARFRVTARTEGGHSFGAFGKPNAIVELSRLIMELSKIEIPAMPGTKTTYNIGTISGGTSVNTIAQEATMLCEYRSNSRDCMAYMQSQFDKAFQWAKQHTELEVVPVGLRPCAGDVDPAALQALIQKADESIALSVGLEPVHKLGSTDSNLPLSLGIPSVCIGVAEGYHVHTREEFLVLSSLLGGMRRALALMSDYFNCS